MQTRLSGKCSNQEKMRSLQQDDRRQLRFAIGGMCSIRWLPIVWTQTLLARLALRLILPTHDGRLLNWSAWGPTKITEATARRRSLTAASVAVRLRFLRCNPKLPSPRMLVILRTL